METHPDCMPHYSVTRNAARSPRRKLRNAPPSNVASRATTEGPDGNAYTEVGENFHGYCCSTKHYFSNNESLVNTLEITPRLVICKNRLKLSDTYEQSIYVRNRGLFPRRLTYYTDSSSDTFIDIEKSKRIEDLQPDQGVFVNVAVIPTDKTNINRRRHIFIVSEHPYITFEVPIIIVVDKNALPSLPESIKFPATIPRTRTYYEFAVYNPAPEASSVVIKSNNLNLLVNLKSIGVTPIPKKDYVRVLLILTVRDMNAVTDILKIKLAGRVFIDLPFRHEPKLSSLFLSAQHIPFEELKFERNSQKEFRACNESQESLEYSVRFLTNGAELFELKRRTEEYESTDEVQLSAQSSISGSFEEQHRVHPKQYVQDVLDIKSHRHFAINTKGGQIKPNSSNTFTVVFHPVQDADCNFDDDADPPFLVSTKLIFEIKDELHTEQMSVFVSGLISGPEVEFTPKNIDLRMIYLGEEHCQQIIALNVDGQVNANVYFKDYTPRSAAECVLSPADGYYLESCKKGAFLLTMFTRIIGKTVVRLRFKVRNGNHYYVTIRGISQQIRPRSFPDIIELGSIPIAVPQKRKVLLMNPLSVPMTIHLKPTEDGTEIPLTLNIRNVEEVLPITVKNPVKEAPSDDEEEKYGVECASMQGSERSESAASYNTFMDRSSMSSYSTAFEEEVLHPLDGIAENIVHTSKQIKLFEKTEAEKRFMQEALDYLLELEYFKDFDYSNYKYMNWNSIPNDPREVYVDNEIIHLQPNTGKALTILIIPNNVGYCSRSLDIRCCPQNPFNPLKQIEDCNHLVHSRLMISKLWIEYHCRVPEIIWCDEINFGDQMIYAGTAYPFHMHFENFTNVVGFIFFDVVPYGVDGEMFFIDNTWKFCILPENDYYSYCTVIFHKFGAVRLSGLVKFVGCPVGKPFHIIANVLPMRVSITPTVIHKRQNVLQFTRVYIYIVNLTPTRTWITLSLKHNDFQFIEPKGGILAPTGQGFYVTLFTKYYDPELYKNILYVNVRSGYIKEVPIHFNIQGMPIFFEPNIKEGLNVGIILTNTVANFNADIPKFSKNIKVINRGYRSYRLTIQKSKGNNSQCGRPDSRARLNITPKTLLMAPLSEDFIHITANAYEETTVYNEFRIEIVDQTNKKRFENIHFVVTARFIYPELIWSKNDICMIYHRTHRQKERLKLELVKLINLAENDVENVSLKVCGPFKIRELFEHRFKKELDFNMCGAERKEFTIFLNKCLIVDKFCTHVDGRVLCMVNDKQQKSLRLRVKIFNPELRISQPEKVLFTDNFENTSVVEIENIGCLEASYKWKKLYESTSFVGNYDDEVDFASELLSDIFRMLDIAEEESEVDSIYERNMTLRYQKYRCKLLNCKPPDTVGVLDIIHEIIDNLNLEHKRWIVHLEDDGEKSSSMNSYVEQTIEQILNSLKIEDSFDASDISSEACDKERTIYFYEKKNFLSSYMKEPCLVHLPAVRKGYAHTAIFQLDVIGGSSLQCQITAVNLEKTVELTRDNIYLGMRPWYEQYITGVKIQNVTQYVINISLDDKQQKLSTKRKHNRIADGYVEVANGKYFNMNSMGTKLMKFSGIMGFSEEFIREVKITINDGEVKDIRLRGQGIMPIFSVISSLGRIEQSDMQIAIEYELLQRVYYFDVFKGITEEDDEPEPTHEEIGTEYQQNADDQISVLSLSGTSMSSRTADRRFFKLLQTYVMVNNNAELPNATILEQLMETEKFLERLSVDADTFLLLNMVYQHYVKDKLNVEAKIYFTLKHFTIQPLPFELSGHILNMNSIKVNQFRRFEFDLHFFGPGKLIAAARTAVKIPGLTVDFIVKESPGEEDYDFIYYRPEETDADFFFKPYRNMFERDIDLETDPKLKHAHSFDIDSNVKHQRNVSKKQRKVIMNYYNSLNKSVYMERKHHVVLSKIYSKSKKNFSGTKMRVVLLLKPEKRYYDDEQLLEDYLYIDLHMGPTLPVLMRGMVKY